MAGVVLIGFMASGKSTVGRKLAEELHLPWHDTDTLFANRHSTDPGTYIRNYGEAAFRVMEFEVLQKTLSSSLPDMIIATGGGIVTYPASRNLLISHTPVVWLRVQPQTVLQRTRSDAVDRPLLQQTSIDPQAHVQNLMALRNPLYAECANVVIDVDGREPSEIVEWIKTQLRSSLHPDG